MDVNEESTSSQFLDLPPEVRVEIYKYAFPEKIILKTWDENFRLHERQYAVDLPHHVRPKFMFASRVIRDECLPIFWSRVVFDHTYLSVEDWRGAQTLDTFDHNFPSGEAPGGWASSKAKDDDHTASIHVTYEQIREVQHVIVATGEGSRIMDWLYNFPLLKTITIHIPGSCVTERGLRSAYHQLRRSVSEADAALTPPIGPDLNPPIIDLQAILHMFFLLFFASHGENCDVIRNIGKLGDEYHVTVQFPPRRIWQQWHKLLLNGDVEQHVHEATLWASYDWNANLTTCSLENIREETSPATQDQIRDAKYEAYELDRFKFKEHVYRTPLDVMRVKAFPYLDQLIVRELEERGLTPPFGLEKKRQQAQLIRLGASA